MNYFKSLLLLLTFPVVGFSQMTEDEVRQMVASASQQELVITSSTMIQDMYYYHAEIVVDKLLSMNPQSANYHYRKGFLILNARQDYMNALPYLQKAVENTDKNYDAYSEKELSAPIDAFYYLGVCYHLNENLDEARKNFNQFLTLSQKKSPLIDLAQLKLQQCDVADHMIKNPKSAEVKNIGDQVNTKYPEYAPVVSLDGTSLYFTSRRPWEDNSTDDFRDPMLNDFPEDIYVSYQDFEGNWTSPEKLAFCEGQYNEATIAVSSDERRVYVYQDATGGGDIYFSDFEGNKFENLEKLRNKGVNTDSWETHCTVTPDGQNMYFVSDRPGGLGGRDIYRIVKLPNGEWSEPLNMGPGINTEFDEDSPYIDVNNKTLYYSSNGPLSMGGFDVFVTFRDDDNAWSTPINLGYPINSAGDDIYYTTTIDGLRGYLSSFRKGGYGEKDIYEIRNDYLGNHPISSLRGAIVSVDGKPVPDNMRVKLECKTTKSEEHRFSEPRLKNDGFFSVLDRCSDYVVYFYEGDELIKTEEFTTLCSNENEEIVKNLYIGEYILALSVSDDKTMAMLPDAKVEILDDKGNVLETVTTDANGKFSSNFLKDKEYGDQIHYDIRVSKPDYLTQTFVLDATLGKGAMIEMPMLLTRKEVGTDLAKVFDLSPIYFDVDKSDIRPDAAIELDKIVKIMNENPDIMIELGSHTDCRASKSYNLSLSNRRAKASAAYIQQRIDNPKRIYGKGYGESKLVNRCECEGNVQVDCTEEQHQENRRTEFRIVKK